MQFPRLLGDVGGTNARWAWQNSPGQAPEHIRVYPCANSATPLESIRQYLSAIQAPNPKAACLGVATAITGDLVQFTNSPWEFSISALKQEFGLKQCLVINDFTALAMSLPCLTSKDLVLLGGTKPVPHSPKALIGPGTGLGVSGLVPANGHWFPISGEGGHVTLAATNAYESSLLAWLSRQFGHVSAERALSGPGLVNLYHAVCAVSGVVPERLEAQDISRMAQSGQNVQCLDAVHAFARFLGNVAGNLALTLGARGGLYVGGGVIPHLGAAFKATVFRECFEGKGRFTNYLEPIPTWLITAETPALLGAAQALDTQAD